MMRIRLLDADDYKQWRELWEAYLAFYKTDLAPTVTDGLFNKLIVGKPHFAFVAVKDVKLIGFVHCLPHASTWSLEDYCYLEDLFVADDARGSGAGRQLIEAVYAEADRRGCARVYWHTDDDNVVARKLYDNLASLTNFVQYRR